MTWVNSHRPGYFGRARDRIVWTLNNAHGKDGWRLAWVVNDNSYLFAEACVIFYEKSYYEYLKNRADDLRFICSFGECIDNALSNVQSGFDYTKQESSSTHIQDIAIRNVLRALNLKFEGPKGKILVIRGADSEGFRFNPGNVPLFAPHIITQPSEAPKWAKPGSVEDFWQSNKWIQLRK